MKVKVRKPNDVEQFNYSMGLIKSQKGKAQNLLFEEIENDVNDKEKFVIEQIERLREMNDNYQTMIEYEQVLLSVQTYMSSLGAGGGIHTAINRKSVDEEQKISSIN